MEKKTIQQKRFPTARTLPEATRVRKDVSKHSMTHNLPVYLISHNNSVQNVKRNRTNVATRKRANKCRKGDIGEQMSH